MKDVTPVSYYVLSHLSYFHWVDAQEANAIHASVSPNDEVAVKHMLLSLWLPRMSALPFWEHLRNALKLNLRYYLTTQCFPINEVYAIYEPIIGLPDPPIKYYMWCWDILFDGEDYHLDDTSIFMEVRDEDAVGPDGSVKTPEQDTFKQSWWPWKRGRR